MIKRTITVTLTLILLTISVPGIVFAGATDTATASLGILDMAASAETCLLYGYMCAPFGCMLSIVPPIPGDLVCHNVPRAFVETVVGPGQSVVPFVGDVLSLVGGSLGLGSGGASSHETTDNLQYMDAHVFDLPIYPILEAMNPLLEMCPYADTFAVNYLSEADTVNWRTGAADYVSIMPIIESALASLTSICTAAGSSQAVLGIGLSDICMWTWGVTYPRTGFSSSYSEPVHSGIAAYRASRVVANPLLRVVFIPNPTLPVNPTMQLAYPFMGKPMPCFPLGTSPVAWDNLTTKAPKGSGYVWILWEKVCCCLPAHGCIL